MGEGRERGGGQKCCGKFEGGDKAYQLRDDYQEMGDGHGYRSLRRAAGVACEICAGSAAQGEGEEEI